MSAHHCASCHICSWECRIRLLLAHLFWLTLCIGIAAYIIIGIDTHIRRVFSIGLNDINGIFDVGGLVLLAGGVALAIPVAVIEWVAFGRLDLATILWIPILWIFVAVIMLAEALHAVVIHCGSTPWEFYYTPFCGSSEN